MLLVIIIPFLNKHNDCLINQIITSGTIRSCQKSLFSIDKSLVREVLAKQGLLTETDDKPDLMDES
jgi:hypothetical protein